ncbi:MAG: AurF N-oxygenase family protein [Acidimicrobiales bacterium]
MTATIDHTDTESRSTPTPLATPTDVFTKTVERLSRQSVEKHFDAYVDVAWDDPDMAIDPTDPRFDSWDFDPLASTEWFKAQSPETRARLGAWRIATAMRIGWEFENVLQRGLLRYAFDLPNERPEFRYLHHEIIEESQHTMMFQEFVNRSGLDVKGMPADIRFMTRFVVALSSVFPELFFLFVLGGEDPVDYLQRRRLRSGASHPIVDRIMRIHVTEEARHISFARQYLKRNVPGLGLVRKRIMADVAPILFGTMARLMIFPTRLTVREFDVPKAEVRTALRSTDAKRLLAESVAKPRKLCRDLGLMTGPAKMLWKLMGVWDDDVATESATESADRSADTAADTAESETVGA